MKAKVDVNIFGCDVEHHNRAELAPCPYCEIDRLRETLERIADGVWATPSNIAHKALQQGRR